MAGVIREAGSVAVLVVGAGALNQAIKAVAIARTFLAHDGIDLVCIPMFADILIDGEPRTALRLEVEDRNHPGASSPVADGEDPEGEPGTG